VDKLKKEAERLRRVVEEQEKSIREEEAKTERDKLIGDAIYAHYNELQTFQERLLKANMQGHDWNTIITTVMAAKKTGKLLRLTLKGSTAKTSH
jgi:predicted ribosome quality control (RQC) complex YloA/Tae2 family protein